MAAGVAADAAGEGAGAAAAAAEEEELEADDEEGPAPAPPVRTRETFRMNLLPNGAMTSSGLFRSSHTAINEGRGGGGDEGGG